MLIFTFFVLFLVFIHDLTMTELGNNSIIEKRVLLMFLVAVQVTGKAKKFIYKFTYLMIRLNYCSSL